MNHNEGTIRGYRLVNRYINRGRTKIIKLLVYTFIKPKFIEIFIWERIHKSERSGLTDARE